MWQGDVLQVTLANQIGDSKPDSGIAKASTVARLVSLGPSVGPGLCLKSNISCEIVWITPVASLLLVKCL